MPPPLTGESAGPTAPPPARSPGPELGGAKAGGLWRGLAGSSLLQHLTTWQPSEVQGGQRQQLRLCADEGTEVQRGGVTWLRLSAELFVADGGARGCDGVGTWLGCLPPHPTSNEAWRAVPVQLGFEEGKFHKTDLIFE